jgi:hypothetical protein
MITDNISQERESEKIWYIYTFFSQVSGVTNGHYKLSAVTIVNNDRNMNPRLGNLCGQAWPESGSRAAKRKYVSPHRGPLPRQLSRLTAVRAHGLYNTSRSHS